jgi:hypothetical protein
MAIDIRATVTCSLGTLISGSISDDYLQGSGLVKTRGSCEISALITPAVGTVVTFEYVKGGVTRSIPRKLRVLSSFADPFRRTTKVELGCKLTYLSDLQEPVKWDAFDDPENAGYDADDQRIVTLPIHASSVMSECLTQLGITASSSPLTNKFSVAEFDFGGGYVQVLGDLLVSESYFGYLDTNEVLQVATLDQEAGTGPVYTGADIVDLGPIGTGQLPGEAVTVSYSTLKLKQPEDTTDGSFSDNNASRLWERSVTIAGPNTYYVGAKVFTGLESTETLTTYRRIGDSDVPVKRVTTETASSAKIAGSIGAAYEANDISFNAITTTLRREEELITYDREGNRIRSETTQSEQALAIFGGVSLNYVFSPTDFVNFSYVLLPSARTVSTYDVSGEYQQETSSSYVLWPQTITGQQAVAEYRDALDNSTAVSNYVNGIAASGLVHERTAVTINTVGTEPGRPLDIISASYAKDGDPNNGWRTESKAELELALGSATAQRRIEFEMRYPPDDIFSGPSGGPFTATPSDAPAKANRYGRVQNRLLLGNRSGVNLQLAPERLPAAPFTPLYFQADGLTALYRANGNQWAFDSNGIVCSTDALFWAAVGGTGTFWFPVAPGITTLPAEPAIVDGEMNATNVVLPYNETAIYESRIRLGNVVTKFEYALELLTEVPALVITTGVNISKVVIGSTGSFNLTGQNANLRRPVRALDAESGAFDLDGKSVILRPPLLRLDAGTYSLVGQSAQLTRPGGDPYWNEVKLLLHMDGANDSTVFVDSSPVARTMSVSGNTKISTAQSKFGGASGFWDGSSDYLFTGDSEDWNVGSGSFTIEGWIRYPTDSSVILPVVSQRSTASSNFAWEVIISSFQFRFHYSLNGSTVTQLGVTVNSNPGTWIHFAICRSGNNLYWFRDGNLLQTSALTGTIFNSSASLYIGSRVDTSGSWNGYIDELRFTRAARYTSSFTVQTQAFPEYLLSA